MEAGKVKIRGNEQAIDLVDAMIVAADDSFTDEEVAELNVQLVQPVVMFRHVYCKLNELFN